MEFETCALEGSVQTVGQNTRVAIQMAGAWKKFKPLPNHTLDWPSSAWFDSTFFCRTQSQPSSSFGNLLANSLCVRDQRVRPEYHVSGLEFRFPLFPTKNAVTVHAESRVDDALNAMPVIDWHTADSHDASASLACGISSLGDRQRITIANMSYMSRHEFDMLLTPSDITAMKPDDFPHHIAVLLKNAGLLAFLDNDIHGATHLACFALDALETVRMSAPELMQTLKDAAHCRLTKASSRGRLGTCCNELALGGLCLFVDEFVIDDVQLDILVQTISLQLEEVAYMREMEDAQAQIIFWDGGLERWSKSWPQLRVPCMVQMSAMLLARLLRQAFRESGVTRISIQDVRNIYATFAPLRRLREVLSAFYPGQDILNKLDFLGIELDQVAFEDRGQWHGHWPQTKRRDCFLADGIRLAPGPRRSAAAGSGVTNGSAANDDIVLRLSVDPERGAGLELAPTWWGMRVDEVDEEPGQPGLAGGDTITSIDGKRLDGLGDEAETNNVFASAFRDGAIITVASKQIHGARLPTEAQAWPATFRNDLMLLGEKCEITVSIFADGVEFIGPAAAMGLAKEEMQKILNYYAGTAGTNAIEFSVVGNNCNSLVQLDPYVVKYTHDTISSRFRNGELLDKTIDDICAGRLDAHALLHLELVALEDGSVYTLSNRRLYVFRVLRTLGKVDVVHGVLHAWHSERVQRIKVDEDTGLEASKWDRSYSTSNDGRSVNVRSRYEGLQTAR